MSRPVIVVSEPIHQVGIDLLSPTCEVRQVYDRVATPAQMADAMRDADAVIVRSMKVSAEMMKQSPKLKIISKHGAGLDAVDIPSATRLGIVVANSGNANALGVAEHAVALMLAVLRRVPQVDQLVRNGGFGERPSLIFDDLWEATVGLIGFGNIGRSVGRMCGRGFNSKVLAFDPAMSADDINAHGAEKVETIYSLLRRADIISLHLPLSEKTRHVISSDEFALMKPHAIVINTSRGGTIDEAALIEALRSRQIQGAGIDVFEDEPPQADNPLFSLPNVILSPHIGGATHAARRRSATRSAEAALAVLSGRQPEFFINPDVLGHSRAAL